MCCCWRLAGPWEFWLVERVTHQARRSSLAKIGAIRGSKSCKLENSLSTTPRFWGVDNAHPTILDSIHGVLESHPPSARPQCSDRLKVCARTCLEDEPRHPPTVVSTVHFVVQMPHQQIDRVHDHSV
jgi:hypothetical protein